MKKTLTVITMIICICALLAACGSSKDEKKSGKSKKAETEAYDEEEDEDDEEEEDVDDEEDEDDGGAAESEAGTIASTETWGDLSVGIPEDWEFRKGDALDDDDTRYCSVKRSTFSYFDFAMESEDLATQKYEYNKATYTNEQKDVSGTYGDIDWIGFQYSDGFGGYGFELYGTSSSGKPVRVSSAGFTFDSPETALVLNSLVIN